MIVWLPLLLLGTPPELIVWQFVGAILTGNIDHANIDFRIPSFMHRVLVTPQFHRIHPPRGAGRGHYRWFRIGGLDYAVRDEGR